MSTRAAKKPMSNRKFASIWISVLSFVLVVAVTANVLLSVYGSWVETQLGTGAYTVENSSDTADWDTEYNTADYATEEESDAAADALVQEIAAEGVVLLKNNGALPLAVADSANVTLLGRAAADPIYGGSGSGSVDTSTAINAKTGLEAAGFEINEDVYDLLSDYAAETPRSTIVMDLPADSNYAVGEMPVADYTADALASFEDYNDAAIVVIGRGGGEGGDLTTNMEGSDDNYEAGQHQLELNLDEKQLIALAKENFETVVVLVNASTTLELGILQEDEGIDSILTIGSPGQSGYASVGKVLTGEVNPSGRTVDIYPADFTADPSFANMGDFQYSNISGLSEDAAKGVDGNGYFVQYEEGTYVGYRYYETAATEGFINYDDAVVYPFGYGLSYTSFSQSIVASELGAVGGEVSVDVEVTNTGAVAGKDVVQFYYTAPYTAGGVEKSSVVLGDFGKTGLLKPGESETVTVTFAVEDMASYDYAGAQAYVLDAGTYQLKIQNDSHSLEDGVQAIDYEVTEQVVYSGDTARSTDEVAASNQFDDATAEFTEGLSVTLSRADFAGTFPTAPTEADMVANDAVVADFGAYDSKAAAAESDAEMPVTGAEGTLDLIDVRGLDYDDAAWDELLDQLTVDEMTEVILSGAYNTGAINSIVKPLTADVDGPAGFSSFLSDAYSGTAYPSAVLIASTWNTELAYEMGVSIGNEALFMGVNGWYGPAMNLHRSPFAGRNFEYYSEDGLLSGKLGAQVMSGAASKGVYSYVKHFAMNDVEVNRVNNGIAVWADEQTIRELYLKPFEIAFKETTSELKFISDEDGTVSTREHGATAVMSSFNRIGSEWAGGSESLMTTVLRDEWGFRGIAITDFNLYGYMYPDQAVKAGTDLMLTFPPMKGLEDTESAEGISNIRKSTHNILFAVTNSNAMNGIATGATVEYAQPQWRTVQIGIDLLLGLLLAGGAFLVYRRVQKHRAEDEVTPAAPVTETP
ncbi:beta-glucosidase [Cryobacterium zongtaii]|uniref:Beta-glucosidase n=1 Tax=Cryobacterium zongtaii TaxID=1259217 RepID=A0A2S3ZK93_9MICO|nr:glycoside hydrolase family 3 N-terminal domain-containing protein [Cryobacterium zongtaii]POH68421.1 beta-glucosidase [Cryobacterium zongtaii]